MSATRNFISDLFFLRSLSCLEDLGVRRYHECLPCSRTLTPIVFLANLVDFSSKLPKTCCICSKFSPFDWFDYPKAFAPTIDKMLPRTIVASS
jgi:hypothetical protein